jgi:hypothetical protein
MTNTEIDAVNLLINLRLLQMDLKSSPPAVPLVQRLVSILGPAAFPAAIYDAHAQFLDNDFESGIKTLKGVKGGDSNIWVLSALTEVRFHIHYLSFPVFFLCIVINIPLLLF